jgi:hypothetical protein
METLSAVKKWAIEVGHRMGMFHPVFPAFEREGAEQRSAWTPSTQSDQEELDPSLALEAPGRVNLATGLPMLGMFDVGGNPSGFDDAERSFGD